MQHLSAIYSSRSTSDIAHNLRVPEHRYPPNPYCTTPRCLQCEVDQIFLRLRPEHLYPYWSTVSRFWFDSVMTALVLFRELPSCYHYYIAVYYVNRFGCTNTGLSVCPWPRVSIDHRLSVSLILGAEGVSSGAAMTGGVVASGEGTWSELL